MSPNGPVTEGRLYVATDAHHPDILCVLRYGFGYLVVTAHERHGRSRDSATGEGRGTPDRQHIATHSTTHLIYYLK